MGEWTPLIVILIGFGLIGIGWRVIFPYFAMNVLFFIGGIIALIYGFKLFYSQPSSVTSSNK
jgi:hypothetical protein